MTNHTLKSDLERILGDLCVDYGFCLSNNDFEAISSMKNMTPDNFVSAVFVADRTGKKDREVYAPIFKKIFIARFGGRAQYWNRRFLTKKRKRLNKREKLEVILLCYARRDRMNDTRTYNAKPSIFTGTRKLKAETKEFNKAQKKDADNSSAS